MRIVFFSPNFLPLTGGLENVMRDWALGLTQLGHKVTVITLTRSQAENEFPFEVYRDPGVLKTWSLMREADVVMQFNVSLKAILPWVASRTPMVISHQSTNIDVKGRWTRFGRLKQFIADHLAKRNIACSAYVASFTKRSVVIHNPYNANLFRRIENVDREVDLVFVGRLVSDKGCELLIKAVGILARDHQLRPSVTIVGDGPERSNLERLTGTENVAQQVRFEGIQKGEELVQLLNRHRIMVVPSIWEEPFGIVALEGLACGCKLIVANSGGLPEAAGPIGMQFLKGSATDLARVIRKVLTDPADSNQGTEVHLQKFTIHATAGKVARELSEVANAV